MEEDVKDFDPFDETSSSSEEEKIKPYGKPEKKKTNRISENPTEAI